MANRKNAIDRLPASSERFRSRMDCGMVMAKTRRKRCGDDAPVGWRFDGGGGSERVVRLVAGYPASGLSRAASASDSSSATRRRARSCTPFCVSGRAAPMSHELAGLLFRGVGSDPELTARLIHGLLGRDPNFHHDDATGPLVARAKPRRGVSRWTRRRLWWSTSRRPAAGSRPVR